jgi:integrase
LVGDPVAQLAMGLTFFAGLRKGELQGLEWSDIDAKFIHIRRAIVRGIVGTPKTKKSVRSIPIIKPVALMLKAAPRDGDRVFAKNLMHIARFQIMPVLEKNNLEWKGFHAGRRGLGTQLRAITGNSTAGRDVLGHEDEEVTKDSYEAPLPAEALAAMKLLEAKVGK